MGLNCKNKNKKRDWTKLQFHKGFGLKCKIMKLVKKNVNLKNNVK